ncbi:MAG: porin family protein [Nitrospira sp. SB0666_bin_27]|nr:porin family protein [Nitrospira sp. SB0666_bin_27]
MRRIPHLTSILQRIFVATAVLAVFLLPVFTPDARASEPRWYVGLSVPVMFLDNSDSVTSGTSLGAPYSADATNEFSAGFKVSGMVGLEFGNGFRLQVEGFFARAEVSELSYTGVTTDIPGAGPISLQGTEIPVSGPADQMGAMVNVWYDFNEGSRWRPFIGGGLGFVVVDWGGVDYEQGALEASVYNQTVGLLRAQCAMIPDPVQQAGCNARVPTGPFPRQAVPDLSDTDTVFAYKVGGGLGYELTNHITLQVSYRFFKTNQLEFKGRNSLGNFVNTVSATTDLQGHLFEVGARYRF